MNTDAIYFSFVIETDGSLSTPQVTGCTNADFIEVFKSTLLTWKGWDPCRYYGIPLRTKLILPYKELGKFDGPFYMRQIKYQEQILGF